MGTLTQKTKKEIKVDLLLETLVEEHQNPERYTAHHNQIFGAKNTYTTSTAADIYIQEHY